MYNSNVKLTTAPIKASLCMVGLFLQNHAGCLADELKPPLPVPAPRLGNESATYCSSPNGLITLNAHETSVLLCQATATTPLNTGTPLLPNQDLRVTSATFTVMKTLNGPEFKGNVTVAYPKEDFRLSFGHALPAISAVRKGELWLIRYNNKRHAVETHDCYLIRGLSDPMYLSLNQTLAVVKRTDTGNVIRELTSSILSKSTPVLQKQQDMQTLKLYYSRACRSGAVDAQAAQPSYKQAVLEVLNKGTYSPSLGQEIVFDLPLDLSHELTPESIDTKLVRSLINLTLKSNDYTLAGNAAFKLFKAMYNGKRIGNKEGYFFVPEVYTAIYTRKAQDDTAGTRSPMDKTLSNMKFLNRRTVEEIKENYPGSVLVIRHLSAAQK